MSTADRTKNFMFIVYPDNKYLVENWREVIQDYGHKAFISPIHDNDKYEKDIKDELNRLDIFPNAGIVNGVSSVPTFSSACFRSVINSFISFK